MADRDVEVNVTANDRTGAGLASVERRFKRTSDNIKKDSDKLNSNFAQGVAKIAEGISPKLAGTLTEAFSSAGEAGAPLLVAGVAAAAPLIGATLSAAIIGGAGVGGVIGGVLLAAKDPAVQAAGKQLGQHMLSSLQQDAQPFVEPVLKAIDSIGDEFDRMRGRIANIFSNSSGYLAPLVNGALRAADRILDGVDKLVANAGPVIDQFGESIASIGDHLGTFLSQVANGAPGAAAAVRDLTTVLNDVLTVAGPLVEGLSEIFYWMDKLGVVKQLMGPLGQVGDLLNKLGITSDNTSGKLTKVQTGIDSLSGSASIATPPVNDIATAITGAGTSAYAAGIPFQNLIDRVNGLSTASQGLYDSTTNVKQAVADYTQSIKQNGKTLDANTQKGRDNRNALSGLVTALNNNYQSYVKLNGEGAGANKILQQNSTAFDKAAHAAGLTKKQTDALKVSIGLIPPKKQVELHANTHDAEARIKAVKDGIAGVHSKTVTLTVHQSVTGSELLDPAGHRIGGYFDARKSFAFAGPGAGTARTEAPRPVQVDNTVNSTVDVYLDGKPFAAMVRASSKRDAFRQKVGRR